MKQTSSCLLTTGPDINPDIRKYIDQYTSGMDDMGPKYLKKVDQTSSLDIERGTAFTRFEEPEGSISSIIPNLWAVSEDRGIALQKWEGIVVKINADTFIARLFDKTRENPEEEAELFISDIPEDDLSLLKPGAVFYLSLGYIIKNTSQRIRGPLIKFRRVPAWTKKELDNIHSRVQERKKIIGWSSESKSACTG